MKALQEAFNLPPDVEEEEARSRWQDAHLDPDQRDFSLADHKFKEVANQINNDINKVTWLTPSISQSVNQSLLFEQVERLGRTKQNLSVSREAADGRTWSLINIDY